MNSTVYLFSKTKDDLIKNGFTFLRELKGVNMTLFMFYNDGDFSKLKEETLLSLKTTNKDFFNI